jgi:hypothetical protein
MKNLTEALKGLGIEPVLVQGYPNNSQDFTPVALALKQSGADVLGSCMTFEARLLDPPNRATTPKTIKIIRRIESHCSFEACRVAPLPQHQCNVPKFVR